MFEFQTKIEKDIVAALLVCCILVEPEGMVATQTEPILLGTVPFLYEQKKYAIRI